MPEWMYAVENKINDLILQYNRVLGGTSTEVYHIFCASGREYAVRKRSVTNNPEEYLYNFAKASGDSVFPKGFCIFLFQNSYVSFYDWIKGATDVSYSIPEELLIRKMASIHNMKGYRQAVSSYSNIFYEAKYIESVPNVYKKLLRQYVDIIEGALSTIHMLNQSILENMLDNRGCLTHGDLKPKNIVDGKSGYTIIDWDKICSVSPEFDLVYIIFAGKFVEHIPYFKAMYMKCFQEFNYRVFNDCLFFLPTLYLLHDTYYYLKTGKRYRYLCDEVMDLYFAWKLTGD